MFSVKELFGLVFVWFRRRLGVALTDAVLVDALVEVLRGSDGLHDLVCLFVDLADDCSPVEVRSLHDCALMRFEKLEVLIAFLHLVELDVGLHLHEDQRFLEESVQELRRDPLLLHLVGV